MAVKDATRMTGARKRKEISSGKDCWHIYSLQNLPPAKFIDVVNKVFKGQYRMVTSRNGIIGVSPGRPAAKSDA